MPDNQSHCHRTSANEDTRPRARIYAANKLFLITAGNMSARHRREAARGAKGGITSTNWGLKYKCSKTIIKFWWQITQQLWWDLYLQN